MLGENHALLIDFADHADTINRLTSSNEQFKNDSKLYHQLDAEIRKSEERGVVMSDEEFNALKHQRAVLKDKLYQIILDSK